MPLLLRLRDTRSSPSRGAFGGHPLPHLEGRAPDTPGPSRATVPDEGGGKGLSPGPAGAKTLSPPGAHGLELGLGCPSLPLLLFWGQETQRQLPGEGSLHPPKMCSALMSTYESAELPETSPESGSCSHVCVCVHTAVFTYVHACPRMCYTYTHGIE